MITIRREKSGDEAGIRRVNEEVFMVLPLREGALDGRAGVVRCLPEFREVS